jgi:hypothetical protein
MPTQQHQLFSLPPARTTPPQQHQPARLKDEPARLKDEPAPAPLLRFTSPQLLSPAAASSAASNFRSNYENQRPPHTDEIPPDFAPLQFQPPTTEARHTRVPEQSEPDQPIKLMHDSTAVTGDRSAPLRFVSPQLNSILLPFLRKHPATALCAQAQDKSPRANKWLSKLTRLTYVEKHPPPLPDSTAVTGDHSAPLCDLFRPAQQQPPPSNRSHPLRPISRLAPPTQQQQQLSPITNNFTPQHSGLLPSDSLRTPRRLLASDSLRTLVEIWTSTRPCRSATSTQDFSQSRVSERVENQRPEKRSAVQVRFPTAPTSDKNTSDPKTHILLRTSRM